jgi:uncharacterized protein YndB with AHSA1/START domain
MTMPNTDQDLEVQTFDYTKEVTIGAPIEITWDAVLAELGPEGQMPGGKPFPFTFEPWPGGRWFRDLGNNTGHLWGFCQVIKPPKLLELYGPTFISYPATNHIQYRLTPDGDNTRLRITNRAFGWVPTGFIDGAEEGWAFGLKRIDEIAQRMKKQRS